MVTWKNADRGFVDDTGHFISADTFGDEFIAQREQWFAAPEAEYHKIYVAGWQI